MTDPEDLYQLGMDYINQLKPVKAAECFREAAWQGHADAQFNLGICYEDGDGVEWSYDEAAKWYSLAAAQGHEGAKELLGFLREAMKETTVRKRPFSFRCFLCKKGIMKYYCIVCDDISI